MKNKGFIYTLLLATIAAPTALAVSPAAAVGFSAKPVTASFTKAATKPGKPGVSGNIGKVANVVNSGVKGLNQYKKLRRPGIPSKKFDPSKGNVSSVNKQLATKQPIPPVGHPTPINPGTRPFDPNEATATAIGGPLEPCTLVAAGTPGCGSTRTDDTAGGDNDLTETLQSGVQDSVGGGSGNPDNLFAGDIPTAGLSPEQLGALSPAAGGSLTAEDDRVACMNAYLQSPDAFESAELKQKCAGGVDGSSAI
ncbi:MAG: hypothetical protein ACN2B6_01920 [Rickettsiales bacterium]